jgi:hypothetical protein
MVEGCKLFGMADCRSAPTAPGCGSCIESSILHEVTHSKPLDYSEEQAFEAEAKCFPCSGIPNDKDKPVGWVE